MRLAVVALVHACGLAMPAVDTTKVLKANTLVLTAHGSSSC